MFHKQLAMLHDLYNEQNVLVYKSTSNLSLVTAKEWGLNEDEHEMLKRYEQHLTEDDKVLLEDWSEGSYKYNDSLRNPPINSPKELCNG